MYTKEELKNIDTKRLLTHYRGMRKSQYQYICGCCYEFIWDIGYGDYNEEKQYYELINYLQILKEELNTREHIPYKNKKERKKSRQKSRKQKKVMKY